MSKITFQEASQKLVKSWMNLWRVIFKEIRKNIKR